MDGKFGAVPEGLAMALAQNIYAMHHFSSLNAKQRQDIIDRARTVSSQDEMNQLVSSIIRH